MRVVTILTAVYGDERDDDYELHRPDGTELGIAVCCLELDVAGERVSPYDPVLIPRLDVELRAGE